MRRVAPGEYRVESASWNDNLMVTDFGTGEMKIVGPTDLLVRSHENPKTGSKSTEVTLTLADLDNEASFTRELELMGMKSDSSSPVKSIFGEISGSKGVFDVLTGGMHDALEARKVQD